LPARRERAGGRSRQHPETGVSRGIAAAAVADSRKSSVPNVKERQKDPEDEAPVADAVDEERLLAGIRRALFSYQKPMSRYEQSPTPSQPRTCTRKLPASTSTSMKKQNRFR
jgi:hypothetical protein